MKNRKTVTGWEKAANALVGVQIGLGLKPKKESNAVGMLPKALRFL